MHAPLTNVSQYMAAFASKIWHQDGSLQTYLDFLLTEIDPMFSLKRNAAEVINIITETADTKTFILRPSSRWLGFNPGQYINIEVEINGVTIRRNYSISSAPKMFNEQQLISITVKKIDGGRVSTHLHERLAVGDIITIGDAGGDFTLDHSTTISPDAYPLFIAAGSGITPVMSMLNKLKDDGFSAPITLIYYSNNAQSVIFDQSLKALATSMPNVSINPHFSESEGYISEQQLLLDCPNIAKRAIYLCGPQAFMASVQSHCQQIGVPTNNILQESFGVPIHSNLKSSTKGQVNFLRSGKHIQSNGDKTLLELAEAAGLKPKYGCRSGICHECKCTKNTGRVLNKLTGELTPIDQTHVQTCISIPVGDVSIENL